MIERGSAMPIAYETWTRARRHSPAATRDLAIHLAAYAPERSTCKNGNCYIKHKEKSLQHLRKVLALKIYLLTS